MTVHLLHSGSGTTGTVAKAHFLQHLLCTEQKVQWLSGETASGALCLCLTARGSTEEQEVYVLNTYWVLRRVPEA